MEDSFTTKKHKFHNYVVNIHSFSPKLARVVHTHMCIFFKFFQGNHMPKFDSKNYKFQLVTCPTTPFNISFGLLTHLMFLYFKIKWAYHIWFFSRSFCLSKAKRLPSIWRGEKYGLEITTTYLKSSFIFLKTKDTWMNFFLPQLWQLRLFKFIHFNFNFIFWEIFINKKKWDYVYKARFH